MTSISDLVSTSSSTSRPRKRPAESGSREACAECRRAKQKCDKQWPCGNCRKRGCAAICPDGEIQPSSEKEARKFNAKLLQRQTQLENQVEQLSSALKELTGSNGQSISAGSPTSTLHVPEQYAPSPPVDSGNTYVGPESSGETGGVLRLEKDGESIYVGAGGSSWALQQAVAGEEPHELPASTSYHPSRQTLQLQPHPRASKPPMSPSSSVQISQILSSLPDLEEATSLIRIYFRYVNWLYCVVDERQISEDLALLWNWGRGGDHAGDGIGEGVRGEEYSYVGAQRMAVVVMVLALGSLFNPSRPPSSFDQPQHLYESSRLLLSHGLYLRHFTLFGIQTLHLSVSFLANTRDGAAAQEGWVLLGMAGRLSQAQGLHIDGTKWSLSGDELEGRRKVWWELAAYDRLQALSQGRPVFSASASFNTEKPLKFTPFDQQKYALAPLLEAILVGVSSPSFRYSEALRLDRAVREIEGKAPPSLRGGLFARLNNRQDSHPDTITSLHTIVQRHMHTLIINKALLFLHRPWLGHILSQDIDEPLNSCFGISFSASISAAEAVVENMSSALMECPHEARSFWFFIFHTFSAVVVLSACILRAPRSLHALRTWEALQVAVRIFADWPQGHIDPFVRRALPIVTQLHGKARDLLHSTSVTHTEPGEEKNDVRLRELLGFRSTAAGQSRPPTPPLAALANHPQPSNSAAATTLSSYTQNQPLAWDPSVLSLQNLPQMDLDSFLEGNAFQGDFVTQGLDWIFDL